MAGAGTKIPTRKIEIIYRKRRWILNLFEPFK